MSSTGFAPDLPADALRTLRRVRRGGAPRGLTVDDGTVRLWNVRHRHPDCRTVPALRRVERPYALLRLVFREAPGRAVAGFTRGRHEVLAAGGGRLDLDESA